jgi:transcriptional regulator with XRE-family HTH domain
MMQSHGWTQEQLAEAVGKARTTVTNILKLNGLADSIKTECAQRGDVSKSLLFEIARLDDLRAQQELWVRVRAGGTVRDVRSISAAKKASPTRDRGQSDAMANLAASGSRFLKQLEAADGATGVNNALLAEITALRRDLASLLEKLAAGKPPRLRRDRTS